MTSSTSRLLFLKHVWLCRYVQYMINYRVHILYNNVSFIQLNEHITNAFGMAVVQTCGHIQSFVHTRVLTFASHALNQCVRVNCYNCTYNICNVIIHWHNIQYAINMCFLALHARMCHQTHDCQQCQRSHPQPVSLHSVLPCLHYIKYRVVVAQNMTITSLTLP